jgi:hypothetical protein
MFSEKFSEVDIRAVLDIFYIGEQEYALTSPEELLPTALVKKLFPDDKPASVKHAAIDDFEFDVGDWFTYLFDYGDEWWHVVELIKIEESQRSNPRYPCVIEKHGESPPQYPDPEME